LGFEAILKTMFEAIFYSIDYTWMYYVLTSIYIITVVVILAVLLSENRNPVKSLAWVTVLLLLPFVGIVLYIFFGRSIKNKRMISRRNSRRLKKAEKTKPVDLSKLNLSNGSLQEIRLARSLTGTIYYPDNDIKIFTNGVDKFNQFKKDIAEARHYINIQYYIFQDDKIGHEIRDLLIERARAGVTIRLIYDHVGSFKAKDRFFKQMNDEGIQAFPFFKVNFPPFGTRINWRNHRKVTVIDGKIGYIGGMNIADRYLDGGKHKYWRDTHLRITGSAVGALQYSFAIDWNFMGQPLITEEVPIPTVAPGHMGAQLMTSGPTSQWSNIAFMFHKAISNARQRVYIQTPYFLPTEGLLKALQTAALSKVDVRLMLPRRSDSDMMTYASFSYIAECLQAGIKVYLYDKGMLHAKTLIIDDELTSVGSTNFDFRSFEHNFEANMFIYSTEFNEQMRAIFNDDIRQSTRILPAMWRRRPTSHKILESVLRLLSPIL
jgi:cardiolipin synthase